MMFVMFLLFRGSVTGSVRENVCKISKKRKKSCFFLILKENVKK